MLSCLFLFVFSYKASASEIGVSAQSAVLMCLNTGELLFTKNENRQLSMASTTKIMTSLIALEAGTPEREIVVTPQMVSVEGTSMGLKAGDSISLRELVYGMMLQSGNDAANTVAYVLGGTPEKFSVIMNERAKEIGMKNTSFVTASGLDDKNHYSTAYDMALLACESIKNPEFRYICSSKSARLTYGNPPYARTLTNHNRLLWKYSHTIGIKTGFTKKSGRCLISAAEKNGIILVAVTLNASDDWNDHISMFEYGFSQLKSIKIGCDLSSAKLRVVGGDKNSVPIKLSRECMYAENYHCSYFLLLKPFEYAPVEKGEIVGTAVFMSDGSIIDEIPILSDGFSIRKEYIVNEEESEKQEGIFFDLLSKVKTFFKLKFFV